MCEARGDRLSSRACVCMLREQGNVGNGLGMNGKWVCQGMRKPEDRMEIGVCPGCHEIVFGKKHGKPTDKT